MTEKYIRFMNKADTVSRIGLEKLGYSTKRNDPTTIGQFGSGIKFAPIAAIRKGMEWHFVGNDGSGVYHLEYIAKEEDGINSIFYDYGDYQKPSSFTVDAGVLSWVDGFQIYREALANAIDAVDSRADWDLSIVDKEDIVHTPGWFSCFVTASPDMMDVHRNFDKYFSVNKRPVYKWTRSLDKREYSLLHKEDSNLRIYSNGVLVFTTQDHNSVFDYDIQALSLNEERNVKSIWDVEVEIVRVISSCDDPNIHNSFFDHALSSNADSYYEFGKVYSNYWNSFAWDKSWLESFNTLIGDRVIIYDKVAAARGVKEFISLKGYTPLFVESDNVFSILKFMGIKDFSKIADETIMYDTNFDLDSYPVLMEAIKIASRYEPEIGYLVESRRLGVYSGSGLSIGLTINMNKPTHERVVLIEEEHAKENVKNVLATLIHEFDHLTTGYPDGDHNGRAFRDLADARIADLMVKYYDNSPAVIEYGVIHLPMRDWLNHKGFSAMFSFQPMNILDKNLIVVSGECFTINSDAKFFGVDVGEYWNQSSVSNGYVYTGKLTISEDGKSFSIPEITNVTEIRKTNV